MKKGWFFPLILSIFILGGGCSNDSVTGGTPDVQTLSPATNGTTVAAIALTATPTTVSALGTVAIAATLTDSTGASVTMVQRSLSPLRLILL